MQSCSHNSVFVFLFFYLWVRSFMAQITWVNGWMAEVRWQGTSWLGQMLRRDRACWAGWHVRDGVVYSDWPPAFMSQGTCFQWWLWHNFIMMNTVEKMMTTCACIQSSENPAFLIASLWHPDSSIRHRFVEMFETTIFIATCWRKGACARESVRSLPSRPYSGHCHFLLRCRRNLGISHSHSYFSS